MLTTILKALGIVSDVSGQLMMIKAQAQQAKSQASSMADYARASTEEQLRDISISKQRNTRLLELEKLKLLERTQREGSQITLRAAESGLSGGTLIRDAASLAIAEEMSLGTIDTQIEWDNRMYRREQLGAIARGNTIINQARDVAASGAPPSGGILGLQLINQGAQRWYSQ